MTTARKSKKTSKTRLVAGCDLGKATAKFVVCRLLDDGRAEVESTEIVAHAGDPIKAFSEWYERSSIASCVALGATGLSAEELIDPIVSGLPEEACIQAALPLVGVDGALNLISVSACGYGVFTRDEHGDVSSLGNEKCSSGTGETMVKIAGRFGMTIEEADEAAQQANKSIPITARCSVFAKTEMTHFGNQGKPADELFKGYFGSIANYSASLYERARVDGPTFLIGGGSQIQTLTDALGEAAGGAVPLPKYPLHLEALGAALLAADQYRAGATTELPTDSSKLIQPKAVRFTTLAPASEFADRVTRMTAPKVAAKSVSQPTILGLDLGSTGSKAVLTSIETGEAVLDVYDRTRGNPVGAAQRLVRKMLELASPDIRAVGLTGSGREAVATVMRAAYPEDAERILVLNEIVAHATAAIRCDEEGGDDLCVVEIGGQDAKFIRVVGGQIIESDMNKACSAGTGSFLEEQAVFYGVDEIERFTELAQQATRPPDLGQMCTVFVAEAAGEAHNEGYDIPDLFGGFQYSVIQNYMNRVMGQRTFGRRIFFQGKPATGASLPWTLAAVTGRDVIVPPNPGAMGAWGIGLSAVTQLTKERLLSGARIDLNACLDAEVVDQTEFQCRDKRCATWCSIERSSVLVGETKATVFSGGACPKYELSSLGTDKLPLDAPSPFEQRRQALQPYLEDVPGDRMVGVPVVGAMVGYLPWLVTFVKELGLGVQVLQSKPNSLAVGEARCYSFDACAPVKIAHGVVDDRVDTVFFPKLLGLDDRDDCSGKTCPMEQALPEMLREALKAKGKRTQILSPPLSFLEGAEPWRIAAQLLDVSREFAVQPTALLGAIQQANKAQASWEAELGAIGATALSYGRRHDIPSVVVCGALHVIHEAGINAGIPRLLRQNGVLPIPMDCVPISAAIPALPRLAWADAKRALRTALTARERGDIYPLLLSSFGCGPASFSEQIFARLMEGYPHTALESDGHGGTAGYVTRVQAFLHTVRQHDGLPSEASAAAVSLLDQLPEDDLEPGHRGKLVVFSVADRVSPLIAAAYRAAGFDAVSAGQSSSESLKLGSRDCSGKECLPYQLIWGGFRQYLEANPPDRQTTLVTVSGDGMCRNCMFSIKDQISLERMGMSDNVQMRHLKVNHKLGMSFLSKSWGALVAWDILFQLAAYHRSTQQAAEIDELYNGYCDELEALTEQPNGTPLSELVPLLGFQNDLTRFVRKAAAGFAELESRAKKNGLRPTVLLSGDIYLRVDEFASDHLIRKLNERGLRVLVEPTSALSEYMITERLTELLGLPTEWSTNLWTKFSMARVRDILYRAVREYHPWLPNTRPQDVIHASRKLLNRYPQGEAPITIGNVLHHWDEGYCDGVVVVSPWGCGPALVAESLLRHKRQIPTLFVYGDGTPIDERRLNAFAFRMKRVSRNSASRAVS